RTHPTDAEALVWSKLRNRAFEGFKFRRQVPIGRFVADFVCYDRKLIIELDGGQHAQSKYYDEGRTTWLNEQGFRVIRFWNHEALSDWDTVESAIWTALTSDPSPLTPLPQGERGTNPDFATTEHPGRRKGPATE